jgi:tetratricopeptide (TPR) repeat protein
MMGDDQMKRPQTYDENKKYTGLLLIILIVITVIAFSPSLNNDFTNWDDNEYVTENQYITNLSWKNIKTFFTKIFVIHYCPLVMLSYSLDYKVSNLNPKAYHTTNLVFHLFNCLLVYYLIYLLSKDIYIAFIAALLFGIHPVHVESVAWITERKDVLYSFFFLGSLILYVLYKRENNQKYYIVSVVLFICSLLSKAMAITLPFVLILLDYYPFKKLNKKIMVEKIPFMVLSFIFSLVVIYITYVTPEKTINEQMKFSIFQNILNANYSILFYLKKLLLPVNLSAIYPHPYNINTQIPLIFLLSPVVVSILAYLVYVSKKYTRKIIFGSLFFLITIFPVIQLIPVGRAIAADRYTYIPYIGLFFMAGSFFSWLYNRKYNHVKKIKYILIACIILITGIMTVLTRNRCKIWENSEELWKDVLKKYPRSTTAHINLGLAYRKNGFIDAAIEEYRIARDINPDLVKPHFNLGNSYKAKNMIDEAISEFNIVIQLSPDYYAAHLNLGDLYHSKGIIDQAINEYEIANKLNPDYYASHLNLAYLYMTKGLTDKAIVEYKNVIKFKPDNFTAHLNLGYLYRSKGLIDKAIREYTISTQLSPDDLTAHLNLGVVFAIKGKLHKAINEWQEVLRIDPDNKGAYDNIERAQKMLPEYLEDTH